MGADGMVEAAYPVCRWRGQYPFLTGGTVPGAGGPADYQRGGPSNGVPVAASPWAYSEDSAYTRSNTKEIAPGFPVSGGVVGASAGYRVRYFLVPTNVVWIADSQNFTAASAV